MQGYVSWTHFEALMKKALKKIRERPEEKKRILLQPLNYRLFMVRLQFRKLILMR